MSALYAVGSEPRATVSACMTRDVVAVPVDTTLGAAMEAMVRAGRRHLVVLDDAGDVLAVLSAEAVTTAWTTRPHGRRPALRHLLAGHLLTAGGAHVSPTTTLHAAVDVMLTHRCDAVAVLDAQGLLAGIVTWTGISEQAVGRATG